MGSVLEPIVFQPGSSLHSRFAKPERVYLSNRLIDNLVTLGAIDNTAASVARRVDGIIDNKPANGRVSTDELERMEQPEYFSTLFPEEQARFPALWEMLEAPADPPTVVDMPAALVLSASDRSTPPSGLAIPEKLLINTLTTQEPARRLQLVHDSDRDPETITLADLDQGLARPGRFLESDVAAFTQIQREFRIRATTTADARVLLPVPGDELQNIATLGPTRIDVLTTTTYTEQRTASTSSTSCWSVGLTGRRVIAPSLTLPNNSRLLLLNDTGAEALLMPGAFSTPAGSFVFEVWQLGRRIFSTRVTLPEIVGTDRTTPLHEYADYVATSGTTDLVRNIGGILNNIAHFSLDTTARPPGHNNSTMLASVATPDLGTPGRYPLTIPGVPVAHADIYPQRVMTLTINGQTTRLTAACNNGVKVLRGIPSATYTPSTRRLQVTFAGRAIEVVLDPFNRTL